MMQNMNLNA